MILMKTLMKIKIYFKVKKNQITKIKMMKIVIMKIKMKTLRFPKIKIRIIAMVEVN